MTTLIVNLHCEYLSPHYTPFRRSMFILHLATSKHYMLRILLARLLPLILYRLRALRTILQRWSSQIRTWNVSARGYSMNVLDSRSLKKKEERGRGRSLASKCRWRSSRRENVVRRIWRSGSRDLKEVRLDFCRSD
jgi:hypothetical protein